MTQTQEIVIVGADGREHVFPAGFDPKKAAEIISQTVDPVAVNRQVKLDAQQKSAPNLGVDAPSTRWSEQLGLTDAAPSLNRSPAMAWMRGLATGTGEGIVDAAQGLASNANMLGSVYDTARTAITGKPVEKPTVFVDRPDSFMGAYGAYAPLVAGAGYGLATAPAAFVANVGAGTAAGVGTKLTMQSLLERAGVSEERAGSIGDLLGILASIPAVMKGSSFLPSSIKSKAGSVIGAVEDAAANATVMPLSQQPLTAAQARVVSVLERIQELEKTGGTVPKVVKDLTNRIGVPRNMQFPEGRDFYTNLASLSRQELAATNRPMEAAVKELKFELHNALKDAATSVGQGKEYAEAMNKYAKASSVQEFLVKARPWLIGLGLASAPFTPTGKKLTSAASRYTAGDSFPK